MSGFDIPGLDNYRPMQPVRKPVEGLDEHKSKSLELDDGGSDFGSRLTDALEGVSSLSDEVAGKAEALARGEHVELHDLMISMGKSEVAFNMMLEVRNKLLEAWETLSRSAI